MITNDRIREQQEELREFDVLIREVKDKAWNCKVLVDKLAFVREYKRLKELRLKMLARHQKEKFDSGRNKRII